MSNVKIVEAPVDDIWMRDIAPTFAWNGDDIVAIDWNFKAWGATSDRPARPGDHLARKIDEIFGVPRIPAAFAGEGGAMIVDGNGMVITTRSCLLNPNRNPNLVLADIESGFLALGVRKVIWLEGDPDEPITSGHVDGYAMVCPGGRILVEEGGQGRSAEGWLKRDIATLEAEANGRALSVIRVKPPRARYWRFRGKHWAPCYLNGYVANGAVLATCFGDPERDKLAEAALASAFQTRKIVMLRIDHIANGGGGIRCLTQPMPAPNVSANLEGNNDT